MVTFWDEDRIASIPWGFMKMKKSIEEIKEISVSSFLCTLYQTDSK